MEQIIGCEICGAPAEKRPTLCVGCRVKLKNISYHPDTVKIQEMISVVSSLRSSNIKRGRLIDKLCDELTYKEIQIEMLTERCAKYKASIDAVFIN